MKTKGWICILLGLLLMAAALCLVGYNKWDSRRAGEQSAEALHSLLESAPGLSEALSAQQERPRPSLRPSTATVAPQETEIPDYVLDPRMEMPRQEIGGYSYIAVLSIPSQGLELPVMADWDEYALKLAPCRYYGSLHTDDLVIAGHAYESHFWPLHYLSLGEEVWFTDMAGNANRYTVASILTLDDTDVDGLISSGCDLTLFTCTGVGNMDRLAVCCNRA